MRENFIKRPQRTCVRTSHAIAKAYEMKYGFLQVALNNDSLSFDGFRDTKCSRFAN